MDPIPQIAQAVLYEGYLLWPYRRSALKNQHRFTIGGLYPATYAARWGDRSRARFECLVEGRSPALALEVRFLQIVRRQAMRNTIPVDELTVGDRRYLSWDEAREQIVTARLVAVPLTVPIRSDPGSEEERVGDDAAVVRSWDALRGHVTVTSQRIGESVRQLAVEVANDTAWEGTQRDPALRRTLASCHVVLRVADGAFVSALDPPPTLREAAERCAHDGLWPVLVGEPGERRTLLASPVILDDYPRVAPESPGDLFDGGEIDELLVHSIRALTDAEQREMRDTDPRAREILERTLALAPEQLARLHGAVREQRASET